MAKRRMGIMACLLALCVCWLPGYAQAASTADAVEPILPNQACSLTLSYAYEAAPVANVPVSLYQVAEVSGDFQYSLTAPFISSGLILNGVQTVGEWNVIRSTLEAHILACGIEPTYTLTGDAEGNVNFNLLQPGLYLAVSDQVVQDNSTYYFASSLIALPGLDQTGHWQYQVAVTPKPGVVPPVESDSLEYKVLKLWKGDAGRTDRPDSVEVEIFRNGESYETVILSEENQWMHNWTAKDDGASWMVVERNVPEGYTMTVEERGTSFVLTNTRTQTPPDPNDPPKTGDTGNLLLYILLIYFSGMMLLLLGMIGKRKRV